MGPITAVPDEGLGNSSYIVDLDDGRVAVIDPVRDPSVYLRHAETRTAGVAYAFETHLHADFVSGSRELAAKGAIVAASGASGLEYPHRPLHSGDEIELGGLTVRALATPGHTPEHLSYLLLDGSRHVALFSGGALIPGGVARTDLIAPDQTEELARRLYRTLLADILTLPDELIVYPTHGTGATFCSAARGAGRSSTTIGQEKLTNPLLSAADEDGFVRMLLGGYGSYPNYFLELRGVNAHGPKVYGQQMPQLARLDPTEVVRHTAEGGVVIDTRPIADFAAGHIPGSISDQLRPAFATWLGWLIDRDTPLVFVTAREQDAATIVRDALKIGYDNLIGMLDGGMQAWRAAGLDERRIRLIGPDELTDNGAPILDVRQGDEFAGEHIAGALHRELGSLADELSDVPDGVVVMCGHGERAMTGASLLERAGHPRVSVLKGGPRDVPDPLRG